MLCFLHVLSFSPDQLIFLWVYDRESSASGEKEYKKASVLSFIENFCVYLAQYFSTRALLTFFWQEIIVGWPHVL